MLEAFAEAKHITDGEKRKAYLRFVNKSLSRAALASMIHLTKKKVRQASASDFDQDPWTLNTENGTVDLRTGTLRPHRPEDLLSKMIPLRYDQHAECPQFMAFLFRIMGSHPDASEGDNINAEQMVSYLQKAFGFKANMIQGETIPDPGRDDSFQKFMSNDRFRKFVDSLYPPNQSTDLDDLQLDLNSSTKLARIS